MYACSKLVALYSYSNTQADQCNLNCIIDSEYVEVLVDAALAAGAPGGNVSSAKLFEVDDRETAGGVRFHRERGVIRLVLPEDRRKNVMDAMQNTCIEKDINDVCIYSTPVTRAITYIAEPDNPNATTNRPMGLAR